MAGKRKAEAAPSTRGGWWSRRRAARTARPRTWRTRVLGVVKWTAITGLALVLVAVVGFVILYKTTDIPDPNKDFLTQTSFVYYDGGKDELGEFAVQKRTPLTYEQMPQLMKDAVVAAENRTFWTDNGIDPRGILRAAFSNARGNSTQGGSTITQQYVKILYLSQERSYKRKVKEAILSLKIQREESKEEVLQGYLNAIYFGRGAYGIEAAAHAYFDEDAQDLTLKQSAVLASVLNNPTEFDPAGGRAHVRLLKERYRYVLSNMATLADSGDSHVVGVSEQRATRAARRLPRFPKIKQESTYGDQKGFMLSMVKSQLLGLRDGKGRHLFSEDEIDGGGLRVTTTLTQKAMTAAEQGVKSQRPEGFKDKVLHVGVASVEPGTGALRGFYAGQDYLQSQLNWAVAGGQSGSTFKPFALAAALKAGYSLKDTFEGNPPLTLPDGTEITNEGDTPYGAAVSLLKATEQSINTAYVDLTNSMPHGPEKIIAMANAMGIPPKEAPRRGGPGFPDSTPGLNPDVTVALGSQTVSPINMASAYATIANGGVAADPYLISKVTDASGTVLYQHEVTTHRAMSADIAADVSYALQDTVSHGTGHAALALGRPAAGKTGTATNGLDQVSSAWFAGYTPQLATAVMYVRGKGNGQLDGWLPSYFGADYPARTWTAVMTSDMEGLDVVAFPPEANVDGTPPESGHAPYVPPAPPPSSHATRKPRRTPSATTPPPTSEPPATSSAPSSAPAPSSSAPPPSSSAPAPNPSSCTLLGTCPTSAPPTSDAPGGPGGPSSGPTSGGAASPGAGRS